MTSDIRQVPQFAVTVADGFRGDSNPVEHCDKQVCHRCFVRISNMPPRTKFAAAPAC